MGGPDCGDTSVKTLGLNNIGLVRHTIVQYKTSVGISKYHIKFLKVIIEK